MRVPLSWLREFVDPGLPAEGLADLLTMGGLAVEAMHRPTAGTRGVVVVRGRSTWLPIDGSDKLHAGPRHRRRADLRDRVRRAQLRARRPGAGRAARRGAARRHRDRAAQALGRHLQRHAALAPRELGVGDDHSGIWVLDADAPLGADLAGWLGLDDAVLELEITPDRGYALSIIGVARDLAAMTGAELRLPGCLCRTGGDAGVVVDDRGPGRLPALRRRGASSGVDAARPSPARVQRRLALAGMRPISAIVDATNYGMLETGQPAHAYDLPALRGRITVRRARPGERLVTLDGTERVLETEDLLVCDADGPVALAGIMGGERHRGHRRHERGRCSRSPPGTRARSCAPRGATACSPRPASASSARSTPRSRPPLPAASPTSSRPSPAARSPAPPTPTRRRRSPSWWPAPGAGAACWGWTSQAASRPTCWPGSTCGSRPATRTATRSSWWRRPRGGRTC